MRRCGMTRWILLILISGWAFPQYVSAQDEDGRICFTADRQLAEQISAYKATQPKCGVGHHGCGTRGGPGYRNYTSGECVSWAGLNDDCGVPPHNDCYAECEPALDICTLPQAFVDALTSSETPNRTPDNLEQKPERPEPAK